MLSMKFSKILPLALCVSFSAVFTPSCLADQIDAMDVTVEAAKDSSLHVVEKISANFSQPRHGIFRIMPVKYSRYGADYTLDFRLNSVQDENKQKIAHQISKQGSDVNIKIGSPDKEVLGKQTYVIDYNLHRAFNFFQNKPEIYWNVTGDQWPYDIKEASLTLKLPEGVSAGDVRTQSFLGQRGTDSSAGMVERKEGNELFFQAFEIKPGNGMTVVVGLPEGSVLPPAVGLQIGWFLVDWWPAILIPAFAFGGLYATWRHLGSDEEPTGAIGVDWQPPKELSPAEMGVIVDERADLNDIISIIVDMAARGYLQIIEIDKPGFWGSSKDYQLRRTFSYNGRQTFTRSIDDFDIKLFERQMLQSIFQSGSGGWRDDVTLSELTQTSVIDLDLIKQQLYGTMAENGWFKANPEAVRITYRSIGGALVVVPFFLVLTTNLGGVPLVLGTLFSGILFFFFAGAMPARTLAGVRLRRQSLAFARFVDKAERQRIKVMADKDPTIFGRLLPYALVLGAADRWANAFEGIAVTAPSWYVSSDPSYMFNPHTFVHDIGSGVDSMGTAIKTSHQASQQTSSAGSGGSGFSGGSSGGGFGGGGGGSW